MMILIKPGIYKFYSIIVTILLAVIVYVGYSYYASTQNLSQKFTELSAKTAKLEGTIRAQVTTRAPEDTKPCHDWIGSNSPMAENEVCFYDGAKDIQTNSDIQVWSYSDNKWIEPVGTGDPEVPTIIRPNDTELGLYNPIVIKCPWGCTLGYTN